jgi:hypothetical protein
MVLPDCSEASTPEQQITGCIRQGFPTKKRGGPTRLLEGFNREIQRRTGGLSIYYGRIDMQESRDRSQGGRSQTCPYVASRGEGWIETELQGPV